MTLTEQLRAERLERQAAINEASRREVDPNRYRTDAERTRLAATDVARITAEGALNEARRQNLAVERSLHQMNQADGASLFWRNMDPDRLTPAAREYVERGRAAQELIQTAKQNLQRHIRAANAAAREIGEAAAARRRQAKLEAGQLTLPPRPEEARAARNAPTSRSSKYNDAKVRR